MQNLSHLFLSALLATLFLSGCSVLEYTLSDGSGSTASKPGLAKAREMLQEVPTINNEVAQRFYEQGLFFEQEGLVEDAIDQYLRAAKLRPSFSDLLYLQLGILYRNTRQFALSRDALTLAIKLNPRLALAHLNLGLVWLQWLEQRDEARARDSLQRALNMNPDLAEGHYFLGMLQYLKDKEQASKLLWRYLVLGTDKRRKEDTKVVLRSLRYEERPYPMHQTLPAQRAMQHQWNKDLFRPIHIS